MVDLNCTSFTTEVNFLEAICIIYFNNISYVFKTCILLGDSALFNDLCKIFI